jgi:hypothetical protein
VSANLALQWLLGKDTGISSRAICSVLSTGSAGEDRCPPADPDDFGRCYRLLRFIPEFRGRLNEVAAVLPQWGPMIAAWNELEERYSLISEADGAYSEKSYGDNKAAASAMYQRMRELNEDGYAADGWTNTGAPGCWRKGESAHTELGGLAKVSK